MLAGEREVFQSVEEDRCSHELQSRGIYRSGSSKYALIFIFLLCSFGPYKPLGQVSSAKCLKVASDLIWV